MNSLKDQMRSYSAYHKDTRNKLTHFVGVPLVMYSIFIPMGWFRFAHADVPLLSGATIFCIAVFCYYLKLDRNVALIQMPISLALLIAADRASTLPFAQSLGVFIGTFVLGWVIQIIGHVFEGRRPALVDNILQIFNAPLFLTVEILFLFGMRKDLREQMDRTA